MEINQSLIETTTTYLNRYEIPDAGKMPKFLNEASIDEKISNKEILVYAITEYDRLIKNFNSYRLHELDNEITSKAYQLKVTLDETPLPSIKEMSEGNYYIALMKSARLMKMAVDIKAGKIPKTEENSFLAIGTPTYATRLMPRVIGTTAHLMERTFFEWARKREIYPPSGVWEKDDWLHPLKEILLLEIYNSPNMYKDSRLLRVFKELGWLNESQIQEFERGMDDIHIQN